MRRRTLAAFLALGILSGPMVVRAAEPIPVGNGQQTAELDGVALQVFTYRPEGCALSGILLVFHGLQRNAEDYRDHAVPLARRLCMMVVAPLFDAERFPSWKYQRGGIVHDDKLEPTDRWTIRLVPKLIAWARARAPVPDLPYALLGHSAGAQFLGRVAAFEPLQATRIVIADPSTWVLPSVATAAPYGFGGLDGAQDALRRYLAAPVTVLMGAADTGSKNLATSAAAEAQGANRVERGQNAFHAAQAAAQAQGWPFNWRLVMVPGVAHDAKRLFATDQAVAALRP